jgi:nucleoside-diphosphate-sugar epimerase
MKEADTLVNIASLGFGHAETIVRAAQTARIRRTIFISTTAIFTQINAQSKRARLAAEQAIQVSGLQFTILRPTMIYGGPSDRNMWRLIRFMRYSPVVPIIGDGNSLQQPIYVDDVARAILGCLSQDQTIGKCYNIAGKHPLRYNEVIDIIARTMNKRIWKLHLPSRPIVSLLRLLERLHIHSPIKAEQILRLKEDKSFDYEEAQIDFGFRSLSFEEGIYLELQNR